MIIIHLDILRFLFGETNHTSDDAGLTMIIIHLDILRFLFGETNHTPDDAGQDPLLPVENLRISSYYSDDYIVEFACEGGGTGQGVASPKRWKLQNCPSEHELLFWPATCVWRARSISDIQDWG